MSCDVEGYGWWCVVDVEGVVVDLAGVANVVFGPVVEFMGALFGEVDVGWVLRGVVPVVSSDVGIVWELCVDV